MWLRNLFFFIVFLYTAECAKILGVFFIPGKSHYMAGSTLMKILAEKGHDVTIISPFSEKKPPKNYREVVLTGNYEAMQEMSKSFSMFDMPKSFFLPAVVFAFMGNNFMEMALNHTNFKKLMNSGEKFDVVIMEEFQAETMKYVAHHFNAPLIVYSAMDANKWVNAYQGNPENPSVVPVIQDYTCKMSFMERVYNSLSYVYENIIRHHLALRLQNNLLHKYYPDAPNLDEFIYNVSLVLLNADPSVHEALPKVPSMVNIGGFHIDKPKPLPEDLQQILDNAKNGLVYFSLGSNVKAKDMPKDKRELLIRALSKLKETVLWKFEEDLPGLPDNIIIRKWLPQNDILAHKNVKLFITHGGIFSTMEAVYHGVPLLCLPVFAEQSMNSKRAADNGYAKVIEFKELTEETFSSYLQELLSDKKYKENVEKRSKIMTDKPIPPRDAINYWVEYVIRHKGAPHLRVAALDLEWYQYLLLDVVVFVSAIGLVTIVCSVYLIKLILKKFKKKKEKTQ